MDSETPHPGPSCQLLDLPTGPQTTSVRTLGSEPSKNEQRSSQSDSNSRKHTEESAQMVETPRKRRRSSKDSSLVRIGNEGSLHGKKRHKTSVKKTEPKANGHQDGLAHCPEPQDTDPPPIRKSLVSFLRGKSEEIYRDTVQMQAQKLGSLLTPEQLSQLRQLSESLTAMVYSLLQHGQPGGFAFPAEGWLVPAPMAAPQELSGKESQSPLMEGGEKITDPAIPSDKS
ncbi:FSHD region gene 2 family member 1 [Mus musculus]|uniref:Expressed sequence AA415398 n=1 Tax=Mus musculus TaxID=10090 RepID=Q6P3A2_MOUSE|nr:FSHD region gene 2 family member 1 [Mus musculus]AAH64115.1 Expressed sequence AA415398 [Mus musculus]AAH76608.1 Expressed sequence AA415398 [Mus musculus]|eukprot:NP_001004178.1 FSHD region gene 2 family member 1 [Mus musculus]